MDAFIESLEQIVSPASVDGAASCSEDAQDLGLFKYQCKHHWHALALPRVLHLLTVNHMGDQEEMARSFTIINSEIDHGCTAIIRKYCQGETKQ